MTGTYNARGNYTPLQSINNGPLINSNGIVALRALVEIQGNAELPTEHNTEIKVKVGTYDSTKSSKFWSIEKTVDATGNYALVVTNKPTYSNTLPDLFYDGAAVATGSVVNMFRTGFIDTTGLPDGILYVQVSITDGWTLAATGTNPITKATSSGNLRFASLFGWNTDYKSDNVQIDFDVLVLMLSLAETAHDATLLPDNEIAALAAAVDPSATNYYITFNALTAAIDATKEGINTLLDTLRGRVGANETDIGDAKTLFDSLKQNYNAFVIDINGKFLAARGSFSSVDARFDDDEGNIADNLTAIDSLERTFRDFERLAADIHGFELQTNNVNIKSTVASYTNDILNNVPDDWSPSNGGESLVGTSPNSTWLTKSGGVVTANYIATYDSALSKWTEIAPTGKNKKGFLSVPRVDSSGNFIKSNGKTVYDIVFVYYQNNEWERQGNIEELTTQFQALKVKVGQIESNLSAALDRIATNESAIRVIQTAVDGEYLVESDLVGKSVGTYLLKSESRIVKVSDTIGTVSARHVIANGSMYWSLTHKGWYVFRNGTGSPLATNADGEKNRYLTKLLESSESIPAYATATRGGAYGRKGSNVIYVTPATGTAWATETLADKTLVSVISGDNEGVWEIIGTAWSRIQYFDFSQLTDADIASLKQRVFDVEEVADTNKTALALINTNLDLKENAVDRIETSQSGIGSDIGRFVILTPTLRLRKVYVANPLFPTVKVYKQIDMVEGQLFFNKEDSKEYIVKGGVPVVLVPDVQQQLTADQVASIVNALPLATGTNFLITKTALATALQNITNGNGWTPRIQFYSNTAGDKQYLKIFDWFGGSGTKPLVGFIGEGTALLQNTTGATNLKGGKGDSTGGTGSGAASLFLKFIAKHDVGTFPNLPDGSYIIQNEANGFQVYKYVAGAPENQHIILDVGECFISMDADNPPKIAFFRRDSNGVKEIFVETGSSSGGTSTESLSLLFVDKINVPASALLTTPDGYRFMTDDFGLYEVINGVAVKQGDLKVGYAILAQDDAHKDSRSFHKRTTDGLVKVADIDNISGVVSIRGYWSVRLQSGINIPFDEQIYSVNTGFEIGENTSDGRNNLTNLPSGRNIPSQINVAVVSDIGFGFGLAVNNVVGERILLDADHFVTHSPFTIGKNIGFIVIPEGQGGILGMRTGDLSLIVKNYNQNALFFKITSQFTERNPTSGYSLGQEMAIKSLYQRFKIVGIAASSIPVFPTSIVNELLTQADVNGLYSFDATTYIQTESAERYVPTHISSGAVVFRDLDPLTIDPGSVRVVGGKTLITVPAGTDVTRSDILVARLGEGYDQNHSFKIKSMRDNVIVIDSLLPYFTDNAFLLTLCDLHGIPSPTPYGEYFVYADDLFHEDETYTHAPDVIVNIDPFDTVKGTTHVTTDSALATPYHRHGVWNGDHSKYCIISGYEGIHENEIVGTAILGTAGYNDYLDGYSESDNKGSLTTQTGTLAGINFHSLIVSHFGGVYTLVIVIEKVDSAGEPVDLAGRILRFAYGSTNIVLGDVNVPAKNEALPDAPTNRYEILLTRDIFRLSATVAPRNPITVQELKTTGAQFWVKGEITGNPSTITPVKMVVDGLKKALAENIGGDGVLVAKESFTFGRRTDPRITSTTANPSTVLLQFDTPFHYYNYSEIFILSSRLSTDDNRPIWKLVNLNRNGLPDDDQTVYGTIQATKYGQQKYGYLPNVNIADDPNGATASRILGTHTRFTIGWKTGQTRTLVAEERGPWLVPVTVAQGRGFGVVFTTPTHEGSYDFPDNQKYLVNHVYSMTCGMSCDLTYGRIYEQLTLNNSFLRNSQYVGTSGTTISCGWKVNLEITNNLTYINGVSLINLNTRASGVRVSLLFVELLLLKYPDPTSI